MVCKQLMMPRQKEVILSNIWPLSQNWTQERQVEQSKQDWGWCQESAVCHKNLDSH
jgi:hypothetical protein